MPNRSNSIIAGFFLLLGVLLSRGLSFAAEVTIFGPNQYIRTKGPPDIYTGAFAAHFPEMARAGKLIVFNGIQEAGGKPTRAVSSAQVFVNKKRIFGPDDFNQNISYLEAPIHLAANNSITIELRAGPGSHLTVSVTQEIDPPAVSIIADPDAIRVNEDSTLAWSSELAYTCEIQPDIGSVAANGSITVSPDVTTTYTITATGPGGETTAVTTIAHVNTPPVAASQAITANEDEQVFIALAAEDIDGDPLSYSIAARPGHGAISGIPPHVTYSPAADYNGPDSFSFVANDGAIDSDPATVSLTIRPVNDPPVAATDSVITDEDTPQPITLTGSDVDADTLTYRLLSGPAHGTLTGKAPNLTYTPSEDYFGTDSFTFNVNDGSLDSNTATITLTIKPVNDPPVAHSATLSTDEDIPVSIILASSDIDADPLTYHLVTPPAHGTLIGSPPALSYSPAENYNGIDSFTFTAGDHEAESNIAAITIDIAPVNDAPVARALDVATKKDAPVAITLAAVDIEGDPLAYSLVSLPAHGELTGTPPDLTYTPNPGVSGPDAFSFKATDGKTEGNTASVAIMVYAPTAVITPGFSSPNNQQEISLAISGAGIVAYRYSIDNLAFSDARSVAEPPAFQSLPEGSRVLKVIGKHLLGFWQNEAEATIFTWINDYTAPQTACSRSTGAYQAPFSTTLSTSEPATIYYTVDGSLPIPGAESTSTADSRISLQIFQTTTLNYFAKDEARNAGPLQTANYILDSDSPVIAMTTPENNTVLFAGTPRIEIALQDRSGVDPGSVLFEVNGLDRTQDCTITATSISYEPASSLPEGKTIIHVAAEDQAGNRAEKYFNFSVDTTPLVTACSHPGGNINKDFYLRLASNRPGTIYYTVDGSMPAKGGAGTLSATSPVTDIHVVGSVTVQFFAQDIYGNAESPAKTIQFVFDIAPPSVTGTSIAQNGHVNSTRPRFVIQYRDTESGVDATAIRFWLNGLERTASATITEAQLVYTPLVDLANDINNFKITLCDKAGNQGSFTIDFRVDTVPPVTTISPAGNKYNHPQEITLQSGEPAIIYYTPDGSDPVGSDPVGSDPVEGGPGTISGASPINGIAVSEDTTIQYFAVDLAGNKETIQTAVFVIDLAAPHPPAGLSGAFKDAIANLTWTANVEADITGYNIYRRTETSPYSRINTHPIAHHPGTLFYQDATIALGVTTTYAVAAVDDAGNESGYSGPISGACVPAAPVIRVSAPPDGFMTNQAFVTIEGTASDASLITYVRVNDQDVSTADDFVTWTKEIHLAEGANAILVTAEDEFGNRAGVQIEGRLDTIPPQTASSHAPGIYNIALDVTLTSSESDAVVHYTIDGSPPDPSNQACLSARGPVLISEIDASKTIKYRSIDLAGNKEAVKTLDLTIALAPPVISQIIPAEAQVLATSRPTFSAQFSATTVQLILEQTVITIDGDSIVADAAVTQQGFSYTPLSDLADGTHTLSISIVDEAGNASNKSTAFTIDAVLPAVIVSPPGGWYQGPQAITLRMNKPGSIYYTTDGAEPVPGAGTTMQAPDQATLSLSKDTVLKFFGVARSGLQGRAGTEEYLFDISGPIITAIVPANGDKIREARPTVTVYYQEAEGGLDLSACSASIDGQAMALASFDEQRITFDPASPAADGRHILVVTLQNLAGRETEEKAVFYIDTVAPETTISPAPGTYSSSPESAGYVPGGINITFQTSEPSQTYYTPDGTDPVVNSAGTILYDQGAFAVTGNTVIKYFSVDVAGNSAPVQTAGYMYMWIPEAIPAGLTFSAGSARLTWSYPGSPVSGFNLYRLEVAPGWDGADVPLFCQDWGKAQDGSTITFGRAPDPDGSALDGRFRLNDGLLAATFFEDNFVEPGKEYVYFVQAVGQNNEKGRIDPGSWRRTYLSMKAAVTSVSHEGGFHNRPIDLVLRSSTAADIFYTIDGTEPGEGSSHAASPVTLALDTDTTIKFFSVRASNNMREEIKTEAYVFDYAAPMIASFVPADNSFHNNTNLAITACLADAKTAIDLDQSSFLVDGHRVTGALTETALSHRQKWTEGGHKAVLTLFDRAGNSIIETRAFVIDTIAPVTTITPEAGIYNNAQAVTLRANEDATVYYTLDGSDPIPGAGTTMQGRSPVADVVVPENATLKYFSEDLAGNLETARSGEFIIDNQAPVIISSYPYENATVAAHGGSLDLTFTYGDANAGINTSAIQILDEAGNNIASRATITEDSLTLTLENPKSGAHIYTLTIKDNAGNTSTAELIFAVDPTVPVTAASIKGGRFSSPITIDLLCSEAATIYYSTDGYPPFVGAANTTAGAAPVTGILINKTTKLQFFAVDAAGNTEAANTEIYSYAGLPQQAGNVAAVYNETGARVELSWPAAAGGPQGYHVYRVINVFDREILDQGRADQVAPPERLRLTQDHVAGTVYYDTDLVPGATYWYGVTVIDESGIEGTVSDLVSVNITPDLYAANAGEAVQRALAWLDAAQDQQGYWADEKDKRMLATSQVLNAMKLTGKDNAGIRHAIFYLRGNLANNNDYLARKILTLYWFGQNVDEMVNRLISQAKISGTYIYGWGMQKRYHVDALDTALGARAAGCTTQDISQYNGAYHSLTSSMKSADGHYGLVPGKDTSIYVSALVYNLINAAAYDYEWIIDSQDANGSFGNGVVDTAAVLLWLDLDDASRSRAIDYLISQQLLNGSWANDSYLTGMCVEALLLRVCP